MKTNEQMKTKLAIELAILLVGLFGFVLLASDEAPDAAVPLTTGEWLAIKGAGLILLLASVIAARTARRAGIIN